MTGGFDGWGYLDSAELYNSTVGSWAMAGARLPTAMDGLKATNIDDKILIFGIFILFYNKHH